MLPTKAKRTEAAERSSLLMEKGIDLVHRKMIVGVPFMDNNPEGDIGFPLAANFLTGLHALEHLYVPQKDDVREHIEIELACYGGDLNISLGIFDRIAMVSVPVHMYVYGPCMSGGSIILQAATKRYISQHSWMMLHYGYTWDEGTSNPDRVEEVLRHHQEQMNILVRVYLSRCNRNVLTEEMLRKTVLTIETYIDADTCVRYGLADEIIQPEVP